MLRFPKLVNGKSGAPIAKVIPPADRLLEIERAIWTLQASMISLQRLTDAIAEELGLKGRDEDSDVVRAPGELPEAS